MDLSEYPLHTVSDPPSGGGDEGLSECSLCSELLTLLVDAVEACLNVHCAV